MTENDFHRTLLSEVIDRSTGDAALPGEAAPVGDFKENTFTRIIREHLVDLGQLEDAEICYWEGRTMRGGAAKINGYYVDEEQGTGVLLTCLYFADETPRRLTKTEAKFALDSAVRFYRGSTQEVPLDFEPSSDAFAMAQRFHETRKQITRLDVFLLSNARIPAAEYRVERKGNLEFRFHVWDLTRLFRAAASGLSFEPIEVDFVSRYGQPLPCLASPVSGDEYNAYLTMIPGQYLHDLYEEFGPRLLEANVRSFLQVNGKVNSKIRQTLRTEPDRFLAYNNGISATADHVELVPQAPGVFGLNSIKGLQIVNGGQTMASIHRARKVDGANIESVYVQAKLTVMAPEKQGELVPMISLYANSQNKVNEADFSSNDPFHIQLERLSETLWCPGEQARWFYERVRGQYQVAKSKASTSTALKKKFEREVPSSRRISKTDVARYLNAWGRLPHIVSLGTQKNYITFMNALRKQHGKEWSPNADYYRQLVGKAILYRKVEHLVAHKLKLAGYRSAVVAYAIAWLSERCTGQFNFANVWQEQKISKALEDAFLDWCPVIYEELVKSAAGRNVLEWAKKESCWSHICGLKLSVPDGVVRELAAAAPVPTVGRAGTSRKPQLSYDDQQRIAQVMQVSAEDWLKIHGWGQRTGQLQPWQIGIALTLSGYASGGWNQVPSPKQAKHALAILDLAKSLF